MDGNAGIRGESVEMTRSGFERCSKNEQPTLAIENSLFVQRFPKDCRLVFMYSTYTSALGNEAVREALNKSPDLR